MAAKAVVVKAVVVKAVVVKAVVAVEVVVAKAVAEARAVVAGARVVAADGQAQPEILLEGTGQIVLPRSNPILRSSLPSEAGQTSPAWTD